MMLRSSRRRASTAGARRPPSRPCCGPGRSLGLGLDRVLVLGQELNGLLDPAAQIGDRRGVGAAAHQLELQAGGEQVEAVGVLVAADVARALERRDDRQEIALGGDSEVGEPIGVGELELAGAIADLDRVDAAGRLHVVLEERDGLLEGRLVHAVEGGGGQGDAGLEQVLQERLLGRFWCGRTPRRRTGSCASDRRSGTRSCPCRARTGRGTAACRARSSARTSRRTGPAWRTPG
jgi:hypothetical protein